MDLVQALAGGEAAVDDHFPKADKGAHDLNIDLDCSSAPEYAGQHGHALLCKGFR